MFKHPRGVVSLVVASMFPTHGFLGDVGDDDIQPDIVLPFGIYLHELETKSLGELDPRAFAVAVE